MTSHPHHTPDISAPRTRVSGFTVSQPSNLPSAGFEGWRCRRSAESFWHAAVPCLMKRVDGLTAFQVFGHTLREKANAPKTLKSISYLVRDPLASTVSYARLGTAYVCRNQCGGYTRLFSSSGSLSADLPSATLGATHCNVLCTSKSFH